MRGDEGRPVGQEWLSGYGGGGRVHLGRRFRVADFVHKRKVLKMRMTKMTITMIILLSRKLIPPKSSPLSHTRI